MAALLCDTGARRAEALRLRERDVDRARALLTVRRSKTAAGQRVIPVAAEVLALLPMRDERLRQLERRWCGSNSVGCTVAPCEGRDERLERAAPFRPARVGSAPAGG